MAWFTEGAKTNPGANALLAQTALVPTEPVPTKLPALLVNSTVAASIRFEHRNEQDNGNVNAHTFPIQANVPFYLPGGCSVRVVTGQRFRVFVVGAVNGTLQASLFT